MLNSFLIHIIEHVIAFSPKYFNILNQCPDYKRKSIGTDVCLSGLSHCRIYEKKRTTINTPKQLKPRTDEAQKKRQEKTREKHLFAHDEIITIKV